jgi:hypothetical protein
MMTDAADALRLAVSGSSVETASADTPYPHLRVNSASDDPRPGSPLLTGRSASSCEWCGVALPERYPVRQRRYCSTSHRVMACRVRRRAQSENEAAE